MKTKIIVLALGALCLFGYSSQSIGQDGGVFPISSKWYYLSENSGPNGFLTFRKYAIIITRGVDGNMTFQDLRNVYLFNCSIDGMKPSYFSLVVPREIDIHAIIGEEYVSEYVSKITVDKMPYSLLYEVSENEMFADLSGENVIALEKMLVSSDVVFSIKNGYRIAFRDMGEFKSEIAGYNSLDEMVYGSISGHGSDVSAYSGDEMLLACSKLR